jgi:hypothetical protein
MEIFYKAEGLDGVTPGHLGQLLFFKRFKKLEKTSLASEKKVP